MIVLFEENETKFTSLGLGILSDPISCTVTEGLNDNFELQLVYPVTGLSYSKIKINRLLFTKPNPYEEAQPFRIISITKPINGKVTVDAVHISYDTNGIIVKPVKAGNLSDAVEKIQNGAILDHEFKIYTDMTGTKTFATTNYYNLRALLMGSDSSLMNVYDCELSFDKFKIYLNKQRGTYRGAQVRYAKNMKDLNHVISYEKLYNGVYPFYHQETTETTTNTTSDGFKQVYIVGNKPFQDGWLSYTDGGEPYHPVDESPVQIGSDGDYKDKVYCWNTNLQRYQQKKYNEMVTVIEGVLSPEWIFIDWSALPTLTCKAKVDGYFKLMTEEDWTFHKAGEIVFQGSFKNIAESLIIYYSEVIPGESTSEVTETESVTHVELDDKIIWLDTDCTKDMKHNRILSLDLTSEFDDVPDKDALEAKAKEYIEKNKIGKYKYETRVSFVDLSKTKEGVQYEGFEKILLGDIVKVVYEDMNVDVELRVTSTKYNVLTDSYDSVDLGEKPEKMSSSSVQNGDDISALTNDVGYADITTVNKLVAKIVTADFIKAKDAQLSKAQIEMLETARIKCSGIIEASQFELDTLIAKLLIADNAQIKETLEAGTIKVNGDITISKGSINIKDDEKGTVFNVDREGNVKANSIAITGGTLNINDGVFEVERDGTMHATGAIISGQIDAQSGSIAGFNIVEDSLYNNISSFEDNNTITGIYIGIDGIRLGKNFSVDNQGNLKAYNVDLTGKITATEGYIGNFEVTSSGLIFKDRNEKVIVSIDPYNLSYGLKPKQNPDDPDEYYFNVSNQGTLIAEKAEILSGSKIGDFEIRKESGFTKAGLYYMDPNNPYSYIASITPEKLTYGSKFSVDSLGNVKMSNAEVTGLNSNKSLNIKHVTIEDDAHYKGDYSSSTIYSINDIVLYELTYYKCIVDISNPEEFDSSKWEYIDASIYDRAYIAYNKNDFLSNSSGIYLGTNGLKLGNAFSVDIEGNLIATNVTVSGTIKAEAGNGYLGGSSGFTIGTKAIYNGINSINEETTNPGVFLGTDGIRLGNTFKVDKYGNLVASNVDLTGQIKATYGTIGGFSFNENRLYSTDIEISTSKLKYGSNFEVSSTGALKALSGNIGNFSIYEGTLKSEDGNTVIDPGGIMRLSSITANDGIQCNTLKVNDAIVAKSLSLSDKSIILGGVTLQAVASSSTKTVTFSVNNIVTSGSTITVYITASSSVNTTTTVRVNLKVFTSSRTENIIINVPIYAGYSSGNNYETLDSNIQMYLLRSVSPESVTFSGEGYFRCSDHSLVSINKTDNEAFKIGYLLFDSVGKSWQSQSTGLSKIVAATATHYSDYWDLTGNVFVKWSDGTISVYSNTGSSYPIVVIYIGY